MPLYVAKTLLLEIDVQNDFCPAYSVSGVSYPEGALAVRDGDKVVPPLNALASALAGAGGRVAATQDWHPEGHSSFASAGTGGWPDHCLRGSPGAAFHAGLDLAPVSLILRKGFRPELDSYSAFFENDRKTPTGLEGWIRGLGIDTVIVGGLALDYCVFYSAMDSRRLGFATIVVGDAVRGVGPESTERAVDEMRAAGIVFSDSIQLLKEFR